MYKITVITEYERIEIITDDPRSVINEYFMPGVVITREVIR